MFHLSKVKRNKECGLQADYQITESVDGASSITDYSVNVSRDVHPDLTNLFAQLRPLFAKVFVPEIKVEAELDKIDVRGLSWSGRAEDEGVVITAVVETVNGLKTCINTPRIKMAQASFGFEEGIESISNAIRREVYEFLYNGKSSQLSLFGDEPGEQQEEAENE